MILIYPVSEMPKVIRKTYELDADVFPKLRDFYHLNKDMRHHKAVVYQDGKPVFCLGYVPNRAVNVDPNNPRVQMKLSHFWNYSVNDEGIDYSFVDRYQMVLYEHLEEYSCHTARLIQKHNPDLIIAFTDHDIFITHNASLPVCSLRACSSAQASAVVANPFTLTLYNPLFNGNICGERPLDDKSL